MTISSENKLSDDVSVSALFVFFSITFALAWGILGLYLVNSHQMTTAFGPISGRHFLFLVAVYAPAISAFYVVFQAGHIAGLKRFLSRLLLWRCSLPWIAFLMLGIPLIYCAGALVKGNLVAAQFPFASLGDLAADMAVMLFLGPVEELGWRGVALPLLQRRLRPIWAGLLLGGIWGVWHLPAFLLSGTPQSHWGFGPFFIGSVAVSLILTALFNSSKGSILLAALFHFQLNNPLWPDAQPYDSIFFVAAAALITWLNRDALFSLGGGITRVIPPVSSPNANSNEAAGAL